MLHTANARVGKFAEVAPAAPDHSGSRSVSAIGAAGALSGATQRGSATDPGNRGGAGEAAIAGARRAFVRSRAGALRG
jgi:hypothetical protein